MSTSAEPIPHRLSLPRKVGFTIGDYGFNLYWQSVSLFLMYYYTDAVGLSGTTAGLIYMAASIFDGAIDPLMGALADRTRTRWGRYRPYILWGTIPLALSFAGLYYKPALDTFGIIAVVCATHFLFRVFYTVSSIPYISLTARVTSSSSERSTIAGFRMVFANLAGMSVSYATQPLVTYFGGGDEARGFFYVACVIAIVASCIFPIVYLATREPAPTHDEPIPQLRDYWVTLRHNRAFWIVVIGVLGGSVATTTLGKTVIYYFKYFLDAEESARYALTAKTGLAIIIVASWVYVTRFVGKRHAWFLTTAWGCAGLAWFYVTDINTVLLATLFFVLMHVCSAGIHLTYWSMLPDTVEYGEWRTGVRAESLVFGFAIFCQKTALGLAAGLLGVALDFVGFVPNAVQTPETLHGMKLIIVVLPLGGMAVAAAAMYFYPLRPGIHERIVADLEARRASAPT
jgi:GPH family glycoside/pentoside/hexuronide:cation symporter